MSAGTPAGRDAEAAAEFLRALAHPMRLRILCRLIEGEAAVAGFESELGLRQPNLSQQLAALREAGLVATRREAKSVVYRLADDRVAGMLDALRRAMSGAAAPMPASAVLPRVGPGRPAIEIAPPGPLPATGEAGVFATAGWDVPAAGARRP